MEFVCQVDFSIHDSIAVFTAVLIAHHCFTLEDLVRVVALQSLLAACPSGNRVLVLITVQSVGHLLRNLVCTGVIVLL